MNEIEVTVLPKPAAGFIDDRCATCGHASEFHGSHTGKCFSCSPEKRCRRFVQKEQKP